MLPIWSVKVILTLLLQAKLFVPHDSIKPAIYYVGTLLKVDRYLQLLNRFIWKTAARRKKVLKHFLWIILWSTIYVWGNFMKNLTILMKILKNSFYWPLTLNKKFSIFGKDGGKLSIFIINHILNTFTDVQLVENLFSFTPIFGLFCPDYKNIQFF